ncbi:MAG TPA: XRE family transcriptional regulator [Kofleriaceae bacterium]|jgi:Zn-dependent peptidase ImmA (M78 family)/transcriptional regulator with XRE-family HTH domain
MGNPVYVPITPSVLRWAIDESGYDDATVARRLKVAPGELGRWIRGDRQPSLTAFRELATVLRRPTATFLLPEPPRRKSADIQFRQSPGAGSRSLLPDERLAIREVGRLQAGAAWLVDELGTDTPELPKLGTALKPEVAGRRLRALFGTTIESQLSWKNSSVALKEWRAAIEAAGVLVFLLPLGEHGCRGFSLWNERAPAIVANTHWNPAARIYTLFHEVAHLLTRTNSVCADETRSSSADAASDLERWCEQVAAAALMPASDIRTRVQGAARADLGLVKRIATEFCVSLRAAALRLIDLGFATWALFRALPVSSDAKRDGGGGGGGRTRAKVRVDEYGPRTIRTFLRGVQREVIGVSDAMRYLDISDQDFSALGDIVPL